MPTDHESEKTQCPVHLISGKLAAAFSHERKSSQDTFSDGDDTSSGHQKLHGKGESFHDLHRLVSTDSFR